MVCLLRVSQPAIKKWKYGLGHCWCPCCGYSCLVIFEISFNSCLFGNLLQRESQEIYVRLLDVLPVVSSIFLCNIGIAKLVNNYFILYIIPVFVGLHFKDSPHLVCYSQWLYRNGVGKCIIVDILCPLICSHHVINVICSVLVYLDSTLPKLGCSLDDLFSFGS